MSPSQAGQDRTTTRDGNTQRSDDGFSASASLLPGSTAPTDSGDTASRAASTQMPYVWQNTDASQLVLHAAEQRFGRHTFLAEAFKEHNKPSEQRKCNPLSGCTLTSKQGHHECWSGDDLLDCLGKNLAYEKGLLKQRQRSSMSGMVRALRAAKGELSDEELKHDHSVRPVMDETEAAKDLRMALTTLRTSSSAGHAS